MVVFAFTILLSAFLLFQVELIVAKHLLPWFGGSSTVWLTCMVFFQAALLVSYGYAHLLSSMRLRNQIWIHRVLLFASLVTFATQFYYWHSPLLLGSDWKRGAGVNPSFRLLFLLALSVGAPFLVLASTAPLFQSWWRQLYSHRSPYPLYALSNLGSFFGLISYPFLVEPVFRLKTQALLWTIGYFIFVIGCGYCAYRAKKPEAKLMWNPGNADQHNHARDASLRLRPGVVILWLGLAACASAMLLSTTNQLCKNVAPLPLLWVLPLAIYLLTFALCFESDRRYSRNWFHLLFAVSIFIACFALVSNNARENLLFLIVIYSVVLFVVCMVCHGELSRLKPAPRRLTVFYLFVASGGVLGGVFVSLMAPYFFTGYWEYEITLWLALLLFLVVVQRDEPSWLNHPRFQSPIAIVVMAVLLPESLTFTRGYRQLLSTLPVVGLTLIVLLSFRNNRASIPQPHKKKADSRQQLVCFVDLWSYTRDCGSSVGR